MSFITFAFCLVIVVLIVVWFTHYLYNTGNLPNGVFRDTYENIMGEASHAYHRYMVEPEKLFEKTIGYQLDSTAKMAIEKSLKKEEMYVENEEAGTIKREKMGDATNNAFILANMYNYNVAPNADEKHAPIAKGQAAHYFNRALSRIMVNPTAVVATAPQQPEHMIDRAEDFYDDYAAQTVDQDTREIYVPNFQLLRNHVRTARKNIAKHQAATTPTLPPKVVAQEHYYADRTLPNDPQNVHDSLVNNDVKSIYKRILEKNEKETLVSDQTVDIETIRKTVNKFPFSNKTKKQNARRIVERMAAVRPKEETTSIGGSEREILINVWKRINSPENADHCDSLQESFMEALADGMDKSAINGTYHEVCTMGRCSRVLNSLTMLDSDPVISQPVKTKEILRNEVFMKAHQIIQAHLTTVPAPLSDAYNAILPTTDENRDKLTELSLQLKHKIDDTIRTDYKHVDKRILDELVRDAQAGVE
jgi:hypothetical protein